MIPSSSETKLWTKVYVSSAIMKCDHYTCVERADNAVKSFRKFFKVTTKVYGPDGSNS